MPLVVTNSNQPSAIWCDATRVDVFFCFVLKVKKRNINTEDKQNKMIVKILITNIKSERSSAKNTKNKS